MIILILGYYLLAAAFLSAAIITAMCGKVSLMILLVLLFTVSLYFAVREQIFVNFDILFDILQDEGVLKDIRDN